MLSYQALVLSVVTNLCFLTLAIQAQDEWEWTDAQKLVIEGQAWDDTAAPYDRLPGRAEGVVRPPVWNLSHHSAGLCVRFWTDATRIAVRWSLTSENLDMPHMPATGVSGVDLYIQDAQKTWRWVANGRPSRQQNNQSVLITDLNGESHSACLYLPLYNGVGRLEIGVNPGAKVGQILRPKNTNRPIVFWGTSITQGACASRPGMVHTAILGRRLDRPIINLGFSGNGRMEAEMAELIAEIDASVFVIDCNPNLVAKDITERAPRLLEILRAKHPTTPIVLVEDRTYADAWIKTSKLARNEASRAALLEAYENRLATGDEHLSYIVGEGMLGDDDEATVDSSHPTDLGFVRMADVFEPVLREALGEAGLGEAGQQP